MARVHCNCRRRSHVVPARARRLGCWCRCRRRRFSRVDAARPEQTLRINLLREVARSTQLPVLSAERSQRDTS
eukprot:1929958-Alexandrium_andersonii.AAC.1